MNDSIAECRKEAREAGIPWAWVCDRKNDLVAIERERRETPEGVRRRAWELACFYMGWSVEGRKDFWRVGFGRCCPRITRTGESDFTSIRGYDKIAASIACEYAEFAPEHAGDVSGTERLWAFLLYQPFVPWAPREKFYWEALEEIRAYRGVECGAALEEAPF